MSRSRYEIQVGIMVVVAAVALTIGMLWLKQVRMGSGMSVYAVDFEAVEGLQVSDRVQVRGIRMGAVAGFEILDDYVRVTFSLDEDAVLHDDAVITLSTVGIVGEVVIEVDPGTGMRVQEGHIFKGTVAGSLNSMTDVAGEALREMRDLSADIRKFLVHVRDDGKVVETLERANTTISKIDTMLSEDRDQMKQLLNDFAVVATSLREALEDGALTEAVDGTALAVNRVDSVMVSLEHTSAMMTSLLARIESGEGTAGKLIADAGLYARAESTLTTANRLLDDIRRNPKRYFKLSIVDF